MQRLPSINQSSAVMEGFQDCTEEAIRYMIDVEKLPADDPMVIGLRDHLFQKQKSFNFFAYPVPNLQHHSFSSPHPVYYDSVEQFEECVLRSDNVSDNCSDSSEEVFNNITSPEQMTENTDFINVINFCESRDNESAIRSLAEELISLMEQEEDFFSDDDDDDIDYEDMIEDADQ